NSGCTGPICWACSHVNTSSYSVMSGRADIGSQYVANGAVAAGGRGVGPAAGAGGAGMMAAGRGVARGVAGGRAGAGGTIGGAPAGTAGTDAGAGAAGGIGAGGGSAVIHNTSSRRSRCAISIRSDRAGCTQRL